MGKALIVAGVGVAIGLNYVFTELLDESGLHVVVLTTELEAARGNQSALAHFRAITDAADHMSDPSEAGALRFELAEHHDATDGMHAISATMVHRHRHESPALPSWLEKHLTVQSSLRLRTVFPERAYWRVTMPETEPGQPGEVGRIALLVQQTTHEVEEEAAESFRRSWSDLGFNALTEPGVVRCDLLQHDGHPNRFVARKVFRFAAALEAHEATEHFQRWREAVGPAAAKGTTTLLDTIQPRSSPYPTFKSRF